MSETTIIRASRPRGPWLDAHFLCRDVRRDLVSLQHSFNLVAAQAQCVSEFAMANPFLSVEIDEVCLLRLPIQVRAVLAKLSLNVQGYIKADVHGMHPASLMSYVILRSGR